MRYPSRNLTFFASTLICVLAIGCNPRQPVFRNGGGDLSHYIEKATDIEYPDVEMQPLDEVTQAHAPITVRNNHFDSFWDLSLEEALSTALQNNKLIRGYGTPGLQANQVAAGVDNVANGTNPAGTMYNVAIRETEPGILGTPGQITPAGNIPTNTSLDVNQGVESALAEFDAQFTSSLSWDRTDRPRNTILDSNNNIFNQDQVNIQTQLAKKAATGSQFFLRSVTSYQRNNLPPTLQALSSTWTQALEAEVRQPLLRGRGTYINRMPVIFARISTDQELANLEAQLQNMVTNVEIRYWDLYAAYRNYQAAKEGRDAAISTWRIINERLKAGDSSLPEEAQAREQFFFFRGELERAYAAMIDSENNLRWLMGISMTDGRLIRPSDEPSEAEIHFAWCDVLDEALTFKPELRQERWELKKRQLGVSHSRNGLLPNLNVTGLYRLVGLGDDLISAGGSGTDFPGVGSEAWEGLTSGDFQEGRLGVEFGMPIGYRRELANVRNAQLKLARQIARLEDMELDTSRELTQVLRALDTNYKLAQTQFNRWAAATTEVDSVLTSYKEGNVPLDTVLDSQRRRSQAQIAYYQTITEYNKTIALVHRRKGTALDYCGVSFAEGAWTGKAYFDAEKHALRRAASQEMNYAFTRPEVVSQGTKAPAAVGDFGHSATPTLASPIQSSITPPMIHGQGLPGQEMYPPSGGNMMIDGTPANPAPGVLELEYPMEGQIMETIPGDFQSQHSRPHPGSRNGFAGNATAAHAGVAQESTSSGTRTQARLRSVAAAPEVSENYQVQQVAYQQQVPQAPVNNQGKSYRPNRKTVVNLKVK